MITIIKTRNKLFLIAAIITFFVLIAFSTCLCFGASSAKALSSDDRILSYDYLNVYSVPTSNFSYSCNGGSESGAPLSNAFDNNDSTYWKSGYYNEQDVSKADGTGTEKFHALITINFKEKVSIDRILYASANLDDGKGYPTIFRITAYDGDSVVETSSYQTTSTTAKMLFSLATEVDCTKITLEWQDVNRKHFYNATAREIKLLQPESEELNKFADVSNIFTDFCRFSLTEDFDTLEEIDAYRDRIRTNPTYENSMKEVLDRAESIVKGDISWDKYRQMSVTPVQGEAVLRQEGDIDGYIRKTLKMGWYGSNKQVTGISVPEQQKITVYVDCEQGDPLPQIQFTQYLGSWKQWQVNAVQLQRGKNVLTAPDWSESLVTWPSQQKGGGSIYLINPYTPGQQSSKVKVYIEGGDVYPVFRKGDDIASYKDRLAEYNSGRDTETTYDLTELESDYTQMTTFASHADRIYNTNGKSPQSNLASWDNYMRRLLAFDGVSFKKEDSHYNEMNEHLRLNFRITQPYGAAFGAYQQVGIFYDDWVDAAIYSEGVLGWGFAHEVGHTMDNFECTIGETTNNMISKYDESTVSGDGTRGYFNEDIAALTNDRQLAAIIKEKLNTAEPSDYSYFDTNRYNYLVWWHIESLHPGTWGKVKNMYRYSNVKVSGMNGTERQIYYFCLVTGENLAPYFERFGYRMATSDPVFKAATASAAFKTALQEAIDRGDVTEDKSIRYWYLDSKEYKYITHDGKTDLYSSEDKPEILRVDKTSGGYRITMPKQTDAAHLGYEILEGNPEDGYDVIGFVYGRAFTDTATYPEGYVPEYKIRAFDRGLHTTALSDGRIYDTGDAVCSIGEKMYTSLEDAVAAAASGDNIVLLQDAYIYGFSTNKNITITAATDVTLTRVSSGNLITATSGNLTIEGNNRLTIDGDSFSQNGSVLVLNGGNITVKGTTIKNNFNTSNGGAICSASGTLKVTDCTLENNTAAYGGGIANGSKSSITIENTVIKNNTATKDGGGIWNTGGGIIAGYSGGTFYYTLKNSVIEGNHAVNGGGMWVDGLTMPENTIIRNNTASKNGGGIYYEGSNDKRNLKLKSCTLPGNSAGLSGNAIYVNKTTSIVHLDKLDFDGDKDAGIFINQAAAFTVTDSDLPVIEFPDNSAPEVCKTTTGIRFTVNGLNINYSLPAEDPVYPSIKNGDEVIASETIQKAVETGGTEEISLTTCSGKHVLNRTHAESPSCIIGGNIDYYTCLICKKHFADINCTEELESGEWILTPQGHSCTKIDKVDASCTEDGCEEHYYCSKCKNNFLDKNGNEKVSYKDLIIEKINHKLTHINTSGLLKNGYTYDQCTMCQAKFNVASVKGYAKSYVSSLKVITGKKSFTVKWKKQSKKGIKLFKGYQIIYSPNSSMKSVKSVNVSNKASSKKIKKLKKGQIYYVQVRTYTVYGGKTFYSAWSKKKSVKVR